MSRTPYRQTLPALGLSIERYTPNVSDDGAWYLRRGGLEIGRFRSLKAAQEAWAQIVAESGWTPPKRSVDPDKTLARESAERWARNRAG